MRLPPLLLLASLVTFAHAEKLITPPATPPLPDPIEGIWTGTITLPQGGTAELGLLFYRDELGPILFRMSLPAMFVYDADFRSEVANKGDGRYTIRSFVDLTLRLDGQRLTGMFGVAQMPLALKRGGTFTPPPSAPHHPPAPAPLWTFDMGPGTWAPPVVADGIIYIGTSAGQFHAVNAADGRGLWTWLGAPVPIDGRAVVSGAAVYFLDTKTNLIALNRADGTLRWSVSLHDEQLAGKPVASNPTFNHRAAFPLVLDDTIYCGSSDGGLYALDAATGKKLWRHDAKAPIFSGIGRHGADTLSFGTMDGSVVLLDRRTRQETFREQTGSGVVTVQLVVGDKVIAGSRDYVLYGFNLADGSVAWRFSYLFSWIESTPVLRDGIIYVGASDYSRVSAIDPATGRAIWQTPVHGMNWGSPLVTDNAVFTGTVAQNLPGTLIAHTGGIVALDRATGAVKWQLLAAPAPENGFGGYAGTLALADDKVIAAGFDGKLIALPAK